MLVLSRRSQQAIVFPECGITVRFLRVASGRVSIGVEAPDDVSVVRNDADDADEAVQWTTSDRLASRPGTQQATLSISDARLQRRLSLAIEAVEELADSKVDGNDREAVELLDQLRAILRNIDQDAAREHARSLALPIQKSALLVDDNAEEAELLASFLRLRHFDVAVLHDGQAAIEYLEENEQPDVVLLDMAMPRIDGPSTIRLLRDSESHRSLSVYGVSAGTPDDYGLTFGQQGVNGWFQKPVNAELLVETLRSEIDLTEPSRSTTGEWEDGIHENPRTTEHPRISGAPCDS